MVVRWSRVPPILFWLSLFLSGYGQSLPDFNQAINPIELGAAQIYEHLDTIKSHRKPALLGFLMEEFPGNSRLQMETFYQRSASHELLQLSSGQITTNTMYVTAEGWGTTYFVIADDYCRVIFTITTSDEVYQSQLHRRTCIY